MSRVNLQRELLKDLPEENLLLGKRLKDFSQESGNVTVTLDDNTEISGRMLVGADGIKSRVRGCLHEKYSDILGPEPSIKFGGITLFGGETIQDKPPMRNGFCDFKWIFGEDRLGVVLPIRPENGVTPLFWSIGRFTSKPHGIITKSDDEQREFLKELAKPYSKFGFEEYIDTAHKLISWDIFELDRDKNTKSWGHQNVTLLGDAAHAITPWVGQGAGISIEDAFDLAHRVNDYLEDIPKAIKVYEETRIPRAKFIRNAAQMNFKVFQLFNYPLLLPVLSVYYKILARPFLMDKFQQPILGYDIPKEPLPDYNKK